MSGFLIFIILLLLVVSVWWVYTRYRNYIQLDGKIVLKVPDAVIPSAATIFTFDINPKSDGVVFYSDQDKFIVYIKDKVLHIKSSAGSSQLPIEFDNWITVELPPVVYTGLYLGGESTLLQTAERPTTRFVGELNNLEMGEGNVITHSLIVVTE